MTMTAPTPKTNLAAKSSLARLMAAENIAVEVDPSAPTASFNVEERRLVLPLWDIDGDAYDMLVGHEVSHALYTPEGAASLEKACAEIDPKNYGVAKDYLNVVEDARIERLIKTDYPGLRRSFAAGYREFNARDLFGLKGKNVGDLTLIDRINVHYKIGWLIEVPFSNEELPLVRRVAETRSWDDVVSLTKEIYDYAKKENEKKEEEKEQGNQPQEAPAGEDTEEQGEEQDGGEEQGEEQGEESTTSDSESKTDKGETEVEGENTEAKKSTEGGEKREGEAEGDSEADKSAEETENTDQGGGDGENGNVGQKPAAAPPVPTTIKSLSDALEKMVKKMERQFVYADFPNLPENMVIPFAKVEAGYKEAIKQAKNGSKIVETVYGVWKSKNAADVMALATEFERRKAADAHRKATVAETGSLDPTRLFAYKISDDIFLRSTTVREGKNHGLVVMLDMSGSMSNQLLDTVIQLVNLAAFARRVNIPFKVYGFVDYRPEFVTEESKWGINKTGKAGWNNLRTDVYLLTLLESGTTQQRFQTAAGTLLAWATSGRMGYSSTNRQTKNPYEKSIASLVTGSPYYDVYSKFMKYAGLHLNGTPTNHALMALMHLVPQFQKSKNLQVVNTVILTDGEAGDMPLTGQMLGVSYKQEPIVVLRDPVTRREYKVGKEYKAGGYTGWSSYGPSEQQSLLVQMLRDRTGAKVININLTVGTRAAGYLIDSHTGDETARRSLRKMFSKEGWVDLGKAMGFDEVLALNTSNAVETEFDFDSVTVTDTDTKAGKKELQKAFVKSLESRKGNRPLMARIAELISKNL
jgi:hypothetical protein